MTKTPFPTLGSEDILSAHLNGIQYSIGNVEEVLDLNTKEVTGHSLHPVNDMQNRSIHYRIYEGNIRGWLDDPAPVIYRNGSQLSTDEYSIQPAYGVIIFPTPQDPEDTITADFTRVIGDSKTINDLIKATERIDGIETGMDTLENDLSTLQSDVDDLETDVSDLDSRVGTLESSGGSGGSSGGGDTIVSLPDNIGVGPFYASGSYVGHQRRNYHPIKMTGFRESELDTLIHQPAFSILVFGGTMDAFPLPITSKTTFKQAGVMLGDSTPYNVRVRIGVYEDDNGRPSNLIKDTGDFIISPGEWGYADIDLTLDPGFYWIARQDKSDSYWNGLNRGAVEQIEVFDAEKVLRDLADPLQYISVYGGYRATGVSWVDDSHMPSTFPSNGELFARDSYGSPWLIVE